MEASNKLKRDRRSGILYRGPNGKSFQKNGEPWAHPKCAGCGGASYKPGGGWEHRFIHCETRLAQIAIKKADAKRKNT